MLYTHDYLTSNSYLLKKKLFGTNGYKLTLNSMKTRLNREYKIMRGNTLFILND